MVQLLTHLRLFKISRFLFSSRRAGRGVLPLQPLLHLGHGFRIGLGIDLK